MGSTSLRNGFDVGLVLYDFEMPDVEPASNVPVKAEGLVDSAINGSVKAERTIVEGDVEHDGA